MRIWPFGKRLTSTQLSDDTRCSFCNRRRTVAGSMVEGLNAVCICADCVQLAKQVVDANGGKLLPAGLKPDEWRSAHMTFVCHVRLQRGEDGVWTAVTSSIADLTAQGATPNEAVWALQAKLLQSAASALSGGTDVGPHFTNHFLGASG